MLKSEMHWKQVGSYIQLDKKVKASGSWICVSDMDTLHAEQINAWAHFS